MIADHISNAAIYFAINERLKMALQYLATTNFSEIEPGRYDLNGDLVYALVQEYFTKPVDECELEAHKNYIDVQYMAEGEESIGHELLGGQEIGLPYNKNNDYWLFKGNPCLNRFSKGMFAVFYPQDLHMPRAISGEAMWVKKVVVKIKI